jgi:hypothetical protein
MEGMEILLRGELAEDALSAYITMEFLRITNVC